MNTASLITNFAWQQHFAAMSSLRVLDLACGSGRNGHWFATQGASVTFLDRDPSAFTSLQQQLQHCHFIAADLETGQLPALSTFDIVLVFNYLHRPLFPWLRQRVAPQGILVYETFTTKQAALGKPSNPDFLLRNGELQQAFAAFTPLHYFEGRFFSENGNPQEKAQLIAKT